MFITIIRHTEFAVNLNPFTPSFISSTVFYASKFVVDIIKMKVNSSVRIANTWYGM